MKLLNYEIVADWKYIEYIIIFARLIRCIGTFLLYPTDNLVVAGIAKLCSGQWPYYSVIQLHTTN